MKNKMKYPIDVEKYIAAMRMELGDHEGLEHAYRRIIPIINTAYLDGMEGRPGYPIQFDGDTQFEKGELAQLILEWTNCAYTLGRETAEKEARA